MFSILNKFYRKPSVADVAKGSVADVAKGSVADVAKGSVADVAKGPLTKADIFNLSKDSIGKSHDIISKIIEDDKIKPMIPTNNEYKIALGAIQEALTLAMTETEIISQTLASKTKITNIDHYDNVIISVIKAFQKYLTEYVIPQDKEQDITEAWRHFKIALEFIGIGKYNLDSDTVDNRISKINSRIENISEEISRDDFKKLIYEPIHMIDAFNIVNKHHNNDFVVNNKTQSGGKSHRRATKPHKKTRKSRKTKKSNNRGVRKTSHRKKK
jgi:hypothetical protein